MGPVRRVTDAHDPRVADYVGLTDMALRMRTEPELGLFIAEGELVVRRALQAGFVPRSFFITEHRLGTMTAELAPTTAPVYVGSKQVLEAVTGFHVHRGTLAAFERRPVPAQASVLAHARRVLVLEGLNNHTNLGAIFRSGAGLGMDAVLLDPSCVDPLYRRSVRVSMGQVFAVPYAIVQPWPAALDELRTTGFRLLALTPGADAVPLPEIRLRSEDRVALLLGAEGPGLTPDALDAADHRVSIPMAGGVDSLNVATAAAVACYALGAGARP